MLIVSNSQNISLSVITSEISALSTYFFDPTCLFVNKKRSPLHVYSRYMCIRRASFATSLLKSVIWNEICGSGSLKYSLAKSFAVALQHQRETCFFEQLWWYFYPTLFYIAFVIKNELTPISIYYVHVRIIDTTPL